MSAVVLPFPEATQKRAWRKLGLVKLQGQCNWASMYGGEWDTEQTGGEEYDSWQDQWLFKQLEKQLGPSPHAPRTAPEMRKRIAEANAAIEKRARVKNWLRSQGATVDDLASPESALYFLAERAMPKPLPRLGPTPNARAPSPRFKHHRVNHSRSFVGRGGQHINGIENFWNQSKRVLRKYNGVPRRHFFLFLKECEFRFNYGTPRQQLQTLKTWLDL